MDIVQHLIHWTEDMLLRQGTWAVFWLMMLESACIPVPSEVIMLFAGYLVTKPNYDATLIGVIAAGVAGNVVGSWIAWGVGYAGGRPLVDRYGRWIRLNQHHLDIAHRFFERRGAIAVGIARCLPVVRTFISLPAGIARMRFAHFTGWTVAGCVPWVTGLALLGVALGPHWEKAHAALRYLDDVVIVAIVVAVVVAVVRSRRRRGDGPRPA